MASSIDLLYTSSNRYVQTTSYGKIYAWIDANIVSENDTSVTVSVTAYTCGTSNSDPWRGPVWSGMVINSGLAYTTPSGAYNEIQSTDKSFSYNYDTVVSSYTLEYEIQKATSKFDVSLMFDTDGSLPNLINWLTCGTLHVDAMVAYKVTYKDGDTTLSTLNKYKGTNVTLGYTPDAKNGYTFAGWSTTKDDVEPMNAYANGSTYATDADLTLYAVWRKKEYTVKYNANKPSGITLAVNSLPSDVASPIQYGNSYTISSSKPQMNEYKFIGYGLTPTANSNLYQPGNTVIMNRDYTFYCIWEKLYTKPTVGNVVVSRCDSEGNELDDGECAKISFDWSVCDKINEGSIGSDIVSNASFNILYKVVGSSDTYSYYYATAVSMGSAKSGTETRILNDSGVVFAIDSAYEIRVELQDTHNENGTATHSSVYASNVIPKAKFIIDIVNKGEGIGIGTSAPREGLLVAMESKFTENVIIEDDLNDASPNLFNPYPFLEHKDCLGVSDDGTITLAGKKTFTASAAFSDVFPGLKVGKTYRLRAYRMSGTHKINNIIYFTATGSSTASSASYNGTFTVTEAMMAGRVNLYNSAYGVDLTNVPALDIRFAVYADTSKTEYEPYCKRIGIRYGKSEMYMCVPGDIDSPACLYAPKSNASSVGTPLCPFDSIYANNIYINGRQYGVNKVLWSGAWYMNGSQTATLSEAVSTQPNGIVLVFSRYQDGVAQDWGFEHYFVPKYVVSAHAAQGSYFSSNQNGRPWSKYIYISDTELKGNNDNTNNGEFDGRYLFNDYCVLRYVIGV